MLIVLLLFNLLRNPVEATDVDYCNDTVELPINIVPSVVRCFIVPGELPLTMYVPSTTRDPNFSDLPPMQCT